jgi:AraC family transcriptional regulator of adaptative response/methylated-DNA-[protein]-cysteine methyltransferase
MTVIPREKDAMEMEYAVKPPAQGSDRHLPVVEKACAYLDQRAGERVTLAELAEHVEMSPWHLQRLFKQVMGVSPRDYGDARRSARFRQGLKAGDSIAGATYEAGYGSSSRIYEAALSQLGMTPATYAKGGRGARIVYAIVDSPLDRLLVAMTGHGVCFVCLGEDDGALTRALEAEFPAAEAIERDDEAVAPAVELLVAYLDDGTPPLGLPLDIRATAFQRRVWQELITIPCGETRTYSEIAETLGLPRGQRAVARACATNPVSILVPCHRVLRQDGGLGGYRWGLRRKAALIDHEARTGTDG